MPHNASSQQPSTNGTHKLPTDSTSAALSPPWEHLPPIRSLLADWDGHTHLGLPDPASEQGGISWAPGALDGVRLHHGGLEPSTKMDAATLARLALHLGDDSSDDAGAAFYAASLGCDPLAVANELVRAMAEQPAEVKAALLPQVRWLVGVAAHVPVLRIGLVLLGVVGTPADLPTLRVVGRHDAFTLYAGVAATSIAIRAGTDPADEWWALARAARGWGKIHAVERLAPLAADRPEIRDWLIREGCANDVMDLYLAYLCATVGRLPVALAAPTIDRELLDGACTIVRALIGGGPTRDISAYDDGPAVVSDLIRHLAAQAATLSHLNTVNVMERWLRRQGPVSGRDDAPTRGPRGRLARATREVRERRAAKLRALGWAPELCGALAARCREILAYPWWPAVVRAEFDGDDGYQHWLAWNVGPAIGLDLWEDEFARLRAGAADDEPYFLLAETPDPERFARLVRYAEENLPLERVGTGPANTLFERQEPGFRAVGWLVGAMDDRDVLSPPLVAAAVRSPMIWMRNASLRLLAARPLAEWGAPIRAALVQSAVDEPEPELRSRIRELLDQTVDPGVEHPDGSQSR